MPVSAPGLTWSSPLPPIRSGVADYAAELLPHLVRMCPVEVVVPPGWVPPAPAAWLDGATVCGASDPSSSGLIPLLHVGNNPYHLWVLRRLRKYGGIVVLHDLVTHHLLVEEAAADDDWQRFAAEVDGAHPGAGRAIVAARRWGVSGPLDPFLLPATAAVLRHAGGVIVHNRHAEESISRVCPRLPVLRVPLACAALPVGDRAAWRKRIGVGDDALIAIHLGFLTPAKGLGVILQALAALSELGVAVRLVVAGEGSETERLGVAIREAGLGDRVTLWGWANESDLGGLLAAADIGLVPRYPSAGETSAAVLRCLAAGTPVVVSGTRQFLEFPRDAALRIPPGGAGIAELVRVLSALASSPGARIAAREAAQRAWRNGGHDPATAAGALVEAAREVASAMV